MGVTLNSLQIYNTVSRHGVGMGWKDQKILIPYGLALHITPLKSDPFQRIQLLPYQRHRYVPDMHRYVCVYVRPILMGSCKAGLEPKPSIHQSQIVLNLCVRMCSTLPLTWNLTHSCSTYQGVRDWTPFDVLQQNA